MIEIKYDDYKKLKSLFAETNIDNIQKLAICNNAELIICDMEKYELYDKKYKEDEKYIFYVMDYGG